MSNLQNRNIFDPINALSTYTFCAARGFRYRAGTERTAAQSSSFPPIGATPDSSSPDADTNWHQDGAFLGREVRTLNMWLALSPCGVDAPGLDMVPRRFDEVLPTGTEGALFDWSVSPDLVTEVAGDEVISPRFEPGDALLFDHLFLHRTGVTPAMSRERHAIECWMFAPSSYPDGQIPLAY